MLTNPLLWTAVGVLTVNVAVPSGTEGLEDQFVGSVHSSPLPIHVPSTACADIPPSAVVASKTATVRRSIFALRLRPASDTGIVRSIIASSSRGSNWTDACEPGDPYR